MTERGEKGSWAAAAGVYVSNRSLDMEGIHDVTAAIPNERCMDDNNDDDDEKEDEGCII